MLMEQGNNLTKTKTILVVEDDEQNGQMFEMVIASETPYRPFWIQDERNVLQRMDEIKALNLALLLMDYHLSTMTGLTLYDQLQTVEAFRHTPTIMITAHIPDQIEHEITQRQLTHIEKPFELDTFLRLITELVEHQ
jgi:CheY-like chemotaxis protein